MAAREVEVVLRRQDSNENIIVADNNNEVVQPDKEQKTLQVFTTKDESLCIITVAEPGDGTGRPH